MITLFYYYKPPFWDHCTTPPYTFHKYILISYGHLTNLFQLHQTRTEEVNEGTLVLTDQVNFLFHIISISNLYLFQRKKYIIQTDDATIL